MDELFYDLNALCLAKDRMERGKRLWGKMLNLTGYGLSVYCIWKIFISIINILFNRDRKRDPVTLGFATFGLLHPYKSGCCQLLVAAYHLFSLAYWYFQMYVGF